jgi:hypothetical protein
MQGKAGLKFMVAAGFLYVTCAVFSDMMKWTLCSVDFPCMLFARVVCTCV